jgi:hypothetical protein
MPNRKLLARLASVAGIAVAALSVSAMTFAAGPDRPYRGSCSTVITPLTPPGVFPQHLRIDYDCTLTHLGRTSAVAMQVVTPTGQSGVIVSAQIENSTVYTAANGDTLNVSFAGTALLNIQTGEVRFIGTETFEGGSGRFDDATGSSNLEGTASIFTNVGFFTTKGRLAY